MGYLVGNDFIPHLPNLHINEDGLPILYKTYMDVIVDLDGYINEGGVLNLARFEKYMKRLGQFDREFFEQKYEDLKFLESKRGDNEAFDVDVSDVKANRSLDLQAFIDESNDMVGEFY
jgi:5'-3' exoribonuclease 1